MKTDYLDELTELVFWGKQKILALRNYEKERKNKATQ